MDVDVTEAVSRRTQEGYLRSSLDCARMAEFLFAPKSGEARAFVAALTAQTVEHETAKSCRQRARQPKSQASFQGSVGAFAADLILHHKNQASEGFMYRSVDKDAMGQTLVTVRSQGRASLKSCSFAPKT